MAARPRHTGKVPRVMVIEQSTGQKGEGLRDELREAVEREEYELAAQLRDRLKELGSDV